MGIRCLLGHDFSEPEIEREREEDGEEVVTTVREVKTCARCGETQIVSENTEVTTMEQLTDQATTAGASPSEPTGSDAGPENPETATGSSPDSGGSDRGPDIDYDSTSADFAGPTDDDAEILDDGSVEAAPPVDGSVDDGETPAVDDSAVAANDEGAELIDEGPGDDPVDDPVDDPIDGAEGPPDPVARSETGNVPEAGDAPATDRDQVTAAGAEENGNAADADDGVILDDDTDPVNDRDRGEWPEVEADADDASVEATPWPDQRGEDEGFSAEVGENGGSGVEFGGLTPEAAEPSATSPDAEYVEPAGRESASGSAGADVGGDASGDAAGVSGGEDADSGSGITREESAEFETPDSRGTPTEYYCPECGMTVESTGNSMRAGDICPECKRGYVAERPR